MPSSQILNNKSQYSESWNIGFYYLTVGKKHLLSQFQLVE